MSTTAVIDVFPLGRGADPVREDQPSECRPFGMRYAVPPQDGPTVPGDVVYDEEVQMLTRGGKIWADKGDPTMTAAPTFKDGSKPTTPADFEQDSDKEA
ncbi:hypothetical protein [Salinactinospora qingdaonensis]|uniref:ATP-grasp target RiPP n=1 Tax=Salinactinospora qingdaonensis TaxID=702744 RepID=A0ABP7FN66_9ACTN